MATDSAPAGNDAARAFEDARRILMGIAYRMLGSVAEAEDAVQDSWLRWQGTDRAGIENPRAWLARTVTRLCLDRLKSARARRETYVGPWLPEPFLEDPEGAPDAAQERAEDLSMALMLALERLSPPERAAFLLHDVFDAGFAEIATTLQRSEADCRQLASRARRRVREARPRFAVAPEAANRVAEAFMDAMRSGDEGALRAVLAADVTVYADGGGRASSALNPIHGADHVARFFAGRARRAGDARPAVLRRGRINGLPGFVTFKPGDVLQTTAVEVEGERVVAVYIVRNPDKLGHLADLVP